MDTETLARLVSDAFEGATRDNGDSYRRIRDGAPEWITELVRDCAHSGGSCLPSDWRYEAAEACADALAEGSEDAPEPDIYTGHLIRWLGERGAVDACDQAREDGLVSEDAGMVERIQAGQAVVLSEIMDAMRAALEARAEEDDGAE